MRQIDLSSVRDPDAEPLDLAEMVRASVSMADIVKQFSGETPVMGRIRCPFHHGHDRNLALYPNGYKCYVCGASGDLIGYVQAVTGLDFIGAVAEIDRAFGLGLPIRGEGAVDPALLREAALRQEKRRREKLAERERQEDYDLLLDTWTAADRALRELPAEDERHVTAAKTIDYIGYLLDIYT